MWNNDNNKTVLVLLSTYNGEKYLKEQIESIYRQKYVKFYILVRDDGSSDSTVKILYEYIINRNNITVLVEENIGCILSFNRLMSYSLTMMPEFDYYAFCDQDDVWDSDKLFYAIEKLEQHKENQMRLYTSAYRVVDDKLNPLYNKVFHYRHTLGEALIMINTMGCTQVFTKALMEQAIKISHIDEPKSIAMPNHDGWLYLTAVTLNSYICYDSNPHISYRQHSNNVVGASQSSIKSRLNRILQSKNIKAQISRILLDTYDNISNQNLQLLSLNATYQNSMQTKLKLIFSKDMATESFILNLAYRILIVFNKF